MVWDIVVPRFPTGGAAVLITGCSTGNPICLYGKDFSKFSCQRKSLFLKDCETFSPNKVSKINYVLIRHTLYWTTPLWIKFWRNCFDVECPNKKDCTMPDDRHFDTWSGPKPMPYLLNVMLFSTNYSVYSCYVLLSTTFKLLIWWFTLPPIDNKLLCFTLLICQTRRFLKRHHDSHLLQHCHSK